MYLLEKELDKEYLVINISFEGIGSESYSTEQLFIDAFVFTLKEHFEFRNDQRIIKFFNEYGPVKNYKVLSKFITIFVSKFEKKTTLIIDEVDKSLNNQLFLDFLAMLRNKYLKQNEGKDRTFHSVVLGGVHDVKNMKAKLRHEEEKRYNSPWNIAVDFTIDLSLNPKEIGSMLEDFSASESVTIDIKGMSEKLFYYTSGYPYLVSKLCEFMYQTGQKKWGEVELLHAVRKILKLDSTNFQSLIKNLQENKSLYLLVEDIILNGAAYNFSIDNDEIQKGSMFGILRDEKDKCQIHNRVYEQRIFNYMSLNFQISELVGADLTRYNFRDNFILQDNTLDFKKIIRKFQLFMKEQYSEKDADFVEKNGRLIFLAFLKPIINGQGFDFKEVQISEEKRLDIVVTYLDQKYIVELKIWRGEEAHKRGISQLSDYLEKQNLNEGSLVIFSKNRKKDWKEDIMVVSGKSIFMVWA